MTRKRFVTLKSYKGIRKDRSTKKYCVRKYIGEKEYSKSFLKIEDALHWQRHFHPLVTKEGVKQKPRHDGLSLRTHTRANGVDDRFTFRDVVTLYKKLHFPFLEEQTKYNIVKYEKYFFPELMSLKMQGINSEVLDVFMETKVAQAKAAGNVRRHNFNNDLKCLSSVLNWYRENYDSMFVLPIVKRHFALGIIKRVAKRNTEKMTLEQVKAFLNSFDSPFWRDFAELHFFMAARVQEVGGLQWDSVDFERNLMIVRDVSAWVGDRKFTYLKEVPKNKEQRTVCLNEQMRSLLRRRLKEKSCTPCKFFRESTGECLNFVFEVNGQPLNYRSIQYRYNRALKKAGLYPQFSSTHILRKAMVNIVRQEMGLDAAQAAGGWKSRDIVERVYTDAPSEWGQKIVDRVGQLASEAPRLRLVRSG